ncbi:SAM-dependent methyltransferase [Anabaena sp. CCY 0017]|uniref:SAM-dependent methyltransferase n=1 Tax=Anabaena sp. CCY 0017 TaxID=3103866 RepID=UPI0039C61ED3
MNYKKILFLLATGVSLTSWGFVGCTPQETNVEAEKPEAPTLAGQTETPATQPQERPGDVPYVPTPQAVVDAMLEVAKVGKDDVLYDLGSGDGRIVTTAAQKYGVKKGVGVEINPELVQEANANAQEAGVSDRVQFVQQDLFKSDFSEATVVTLYLLPDINLKLRPQLLQQLKPGTRIVSHAFDMGEWQPEQTLQVDGRTIYYWVVPEEIPANLK